MISLVYAQSQNGVIGWRNQLPWHLPADLHHFKQLTVGHTIIMGRRTYESIGKPLPHRRSIVVTRNTDWDSTAVLVAYSFDEALALASQDEEIFVVGGADIFSLAMPRAGRVYRTLVHTDLEGDVSLPALDSAEWRLVRSKYREPDERNVHPLTFQVYERIEVS